MAEDYTITAARNAGEKPNTHPKAKPGSVLVKWYLKLADSEAGDDDVYCQKQPGNDLSEGMEITGRLEKGEYGWRLFPESQQGGGGGNFQAPKYERVPDNKAETPPEGWTPTSWTEASYGGYRWEPPERGRRIERQHSQEMALRFWDTQNGGKGIDFGTREGRDEWLNDVLRPLIDWFADDLDADVGGGSTQAIHDAPPVTADVSADTEADEKAAAVPWPPDSVEASPAQKGKLTQLFGKAGLSRDAMKAVVLFRCRSEKATKDGASKLIQDLMDGATHDTLLAEIHDAKRAGDPLAIRAAKLIPSDTPLAEDPNEKAKEYEDESQVPF